MAFYNVWFAAAVLCCFILQATPTSRVMRLKWAEAD